MRATVKLFHPDSEDLAFLYGTIVTDGKDTFPEPTANLTVFANAEVGPVTVVIVDSIMT